MDCELKDITVYYELFGEGRPIIMLHGWSLDHRSMQSDMEPLFRHRDGWKRIYLDLPGHGRTPGKDWILTQRAGTAGIRRDFQAFFCHPNLVHTRPAGLSLSKPAANLPCAVGYPVKVRRKERDVELTIV